MSQISCKVLENELISCNGTKYQLFEERLKWGDQAFFIYLAIYIAMVLTAGLMSGLTMGLLSLDMMTLNVMKDGGTPTEKKHARKIIPIVKRHHLLLVTLLLGNAAAVEAMPIFLDRISDPVTAILVSVTAVLIFGEVIPQAICTRFGLAIGARLAPVVYVLMGLFFVVAWPLSLLLDCLLGKHHSTFFRRAELKVLVDLHAKPTSGEDPASKEQLTTDEVLIIKGALDMKHKKAKDAMLPLDQVYMLNITSCLDDTTMSEILEKAHSRIPVYSGSRENIVSLLLVKTLIKLDPDDATPVATLVQEGFGKSVLHTSEDKPLYDLLNEFQEGRGHLALVERYKGRAISISSQSSVLEGTDTAPLLSYESDDDDTIIDIRPTVIGIITLEDVLEELIQEEILDESDIVVDIKKQIQVAKAKAARCSNTSRGRLLRSQSHPPVRQRQQDVQVEFHTPQDYQDTTQLLQNQAMA